MKARCVKSISFSKKQKRLIKMSWNSFQHKIVWNVKSFLHNHPVLSFTPRTFIFSTPWHLFFMSILMYSVYWYVGPVLAFNKVFRGGGSAYLRRWSFVARIQASDPRMPEELRCSRSIAASRHTACGYRTQRWRGRDCLKTEWGEEAAPLLEASALASKTAAHYCVWCFR